MSVQKVDDADRLDDIELQQLQSSTNIASAPNRYSFGFNLRVSPQEDAAQYLPFLNYLEKATGYHFDLHFTPKGSTAADDLGKNKIQFAALGAVSFIHARSQYRVKLLARGLNANNTATYQSFFVVAPNSKIKTILDIKGKKLAFGRPSSTQGYVIPLIMLSKAGIDLSDLHSYWFSKSHQDCAETVISGEADVCGVQDQFAKKLQASKKIRIIHVSNNYPSSGIAANEHVPIDVVKRVTQALLDFKPQGKDRKGLYNWDSTEMPLGFVKGDESDYDGLIEWVNKLDYLKKGKIRDMVR